MKRRVLSMVTALVVLLSMLPMGVLAESTKTPTALSVAVTGDIIEDWGYGDDYIEDDPETGEPIVVPRYFYEEKLSITVTFSDETSVTGELYELENEYGLTIELIDDQSKTNKWGLGSHSFTLTLGELSTQGSIEVVETPVQSVVATRCTNVEGTNGSLMTEYDRETKQETAPYFYYWTWQFLKLEVTMKTGETYAGTLDEIWEQSDVYADVQDDQSYATRWGVGEHTATVNYLGYKTDAVIEITDSDVVSFSVADISIPEGTNTITELDYIDDEFVKWKSYRYQDLPQYTIVLKNEETITGSRDEIYEATGAWIEFYDDQEYTNQWGIGDHTGNYYLLGETATGKVTIEAGLITSISAEPCSIAQYSYGSNRDIWGDYGESIGQWFHYDWEYCTRYTVQMADGTSFTGTYDEITEQFGVSLNYQDDQTEDQYWGIGAHTGTVELMGKSCEVDITITESPVSSVAVTFEPIMEGENLNSETWEENGEIFYKEYYSYDHLATIVITESDGTTFSGDISEVYDAYGLSLVVIDDQNDPDPWTPGDHTVTCKIAGKTVTATVTIQESPIKSVTAEGTCIENWDCYLNTDYDSDQNEIKWTKYNYDDCLIATITYQDGEVLSGTPSEIYNETGYSVYITSDESFDNQWGVGDHSIEVSFMGKTGTGTVHIVETPIDTMTVTLAPRRELVDGDYYAIYDEQNEETGERWFRYTILNALELEVTMKTGEKYAGEYNDVCTALNEWFKFEDPQSEENPWGVGTHMVQFNYLGYMMDFEVTVEAGLVESITATCPPIIVRTEGYTEEVLDEETGEQKEVYYYNFNEKLIYTVTLRDGGTVIGDAQAIYDALGETPSIMNSQYTEGGWSIGTNTFEIQFMGKSGIGKVEIVESPIESIELINPLKLYQELDDNPQEIYNEETGEWEVAWRRFMPEERSEFIVTMKDGTVHKGDCYELSAVFDNQYAFKFVDDQAYGNEWGVGTHTFGVEFIGYQAEFEAEILPYPVQSIVFANPVVLHQATHGVENITSDNNGNEISYIYYDFVPYYTVIRADGTSFTGSAQEVCDEFGQQPTLNNQTYYNEMQIGENTVQISFMNRTWEEKVTIVGENPVASISVDWPDGKKVLYSEQYIDPDGAKLTVTYSDSSQKVYTISGGPDEVDPIYDEKLGILIYPRLSLPRLNNYGTEARDASFELSYMGVSCEVTCTVQPMAESVTIANDTNRSLLITLELADGTSVTMTAQKLIKNYSYPSDMQWQEEGLLVTDQGAFWVSFVRGEEGTYVTIDVGQVCSSNTLEQVDWLEAHLAVIPLAPYLIWGEQPYEGVICTEVLEIVAAASGLINYDLIYGYDEIGNALYQIDASKLAAYLEHFLGLEVDLSTSEIYDAEQGCIYVHAAGRDYYTLDYTLKWTGNGWKGTVCNDQSDIWVFKLDENDNLISFTLGVEKVVGDLDGNGDVDTADVTNLLKELNRGEEVDPAVADVNGDGKVSLADALRLLKQISA